MKQLLLLGAGHAHVHLLSMLAKHDIAGAEVTLVTPFPNQVYFGMVPGFVAGHYDLAQCVIPLTELLQGSRVKYLARSVVGLDADNRRCRLDDGSELSYDLLSVNTGPVHDRQRMDALMPGSRSNALFVRPIEGFVELWPKVFEMGQTRQLRLSVIGGGAAGIELACAVAHRLPQSSVTLISGPAPVASTYSTTVQQRVRKALHRHRITLIQANVTAVEAGDLTLSNGAHLRCDMPLLATGAQSPHWLQDSGLNLDDAGFIQVDACQRSTSHPSVFAVGDVSTRADQAGGRGGVYAVHAGPALFDNLRAVIAGIQAKPYQPPSKTLQLLSCGRRYGIGSWGNLSFEGRWVWYLKDRIDRAFLARYKPVR